MQLEIARSAALASQMYSAVTGTNSIFPVKSR